MSRLPRITGQECIKALTKAGFQLDRVRGSHHILKNADGHFAVVPVHSNEILGPGLLTKILQSANMSVEELLKKL